MWLLLIFNNVNYQQWFDVLLCRTPMVVILKCNCSLDGSKHRAGWRMRENRSHFTHCWIWECPYPETRKTDGSDVAFLININYKPASLLQWKGFRCSSVCQPVPRPITGLHEEDTDGLSGASKVLEDGAIFGNKRKAISVCIPMREEIHWIFMTCILFITWEFTIWPFYYICWIW